MAEDFAWEKLLKLVNCYSPTRCHGSLRERLYHDLRISGDDASDLLVEYANTFNVDLSRFPFKDYFPGEGGTMISDLLGMTKPRTTPYKELTLGDLMDGIKQGILNP